MPWPRTTSSFGVENIISGFIPCNPGLAMGYNPDIHHRRSIRLRDYDYCSTGAYFVTICAFQRECLFGEVVNGEMQVNPFGEIVREEWQKTDIVIENVTLDEFVIMPNHIHGILIHMPSFAFLVITT